MRLLKPTLMLMVLAAVLVSLSGRAQVGDGVSTGADGALVAGRLLQGSSLPIGTSNSDGCFDQFDPAGCTYVIPLREPPNHIFNFTTVTIAAGVTVMFKPNVTNTPVFILATGDVTIAGTINISGEAARPTSAIAPRGGPGGFSGGLANLTALPPGSVAGDGLGPGGGSGIGFTACFNTCYGNAALQPLIGGSGGGGAVDGTRGWSGGGGGGAILIATSRTIALGDGGTSAIEAIGGEGAEIFKSDGSLLSVGAGSGGAVRLVASSLTGSRAILAHLLTSSSTPRPEFQGRIRFDVPIAGMRYGGVTSPSASLNPPGQPIVVFPPIMPTLRIVSIGGVRLPTQPTADAATPDLVLPAGLPNPVRVVVEATHVPGDGSLTVRVIARPQFGTGPGVMSSPSQLFGPTPCPSNPAALCETAIVPIDLPPTGVGVISAIIDSVTPVQ